MCRIGSLSQERGKREDSYVLQPLFFGLAPVEKGRIQMTCLFYNLAPLILMDLWTGFDPLELFL